MESTIVSHYHKRVAAVVRHIAVDRHQGHYASQAPRSSLTLIPDSLLAEKTHCGFDNAGSIGAMADTSSYKPARPNCFAQKDTKIDQKRGRISVSYRLMFAVPIRVASRTSMSFPVLTS